ncbi:Hydramacin-1 [Folsomia candida]|uniref:Hydramacin-1 n=1 Tax=Folsomia candida TaxID=158441 RepID=A0A226D1J2_FOLCA|nr:Hydramacin-1 [Folsomia candida]
MKTSTLGGIFLLIFCIIASQPTVSGQDCFEAWSRCTGWSSGGTGILWKSCAGRCRLCQGRATGPVTTRMWVTLVMLMSLNYFAMSAANPYVIKNCLYHFVNVIGMSTFLATSGNQHLISNFTNPNSLSWKTFLYTRTLNCKVKMLPVNILSSSLEEDLTALLGHLTTAKAIFENPDYIVFYLKANLSKTPNEFPNFFRALLTLTVTSKFFVVDPTSTFLLNLQEASLSRIDQSHLISQIWRARNTNFKGGPVSVPKLRTSYEYFGVIYGKGVVCELGYKYSSSGLYCLLHSISDILNFTAFDYVFQRDKVPGTPLLAVVKKDGHQVLLDALNNPNNKMQVVSHFYNVLPFGFVLDLPLLTVSSTLTEQSLSIRLLKKDQSSLSFSNYLLLIWFVVSIVLIGGFRSAFYRFLTSSVPPTNVPSTLEELMTSKYTMVGSDSFLLGMDSGPAVNILEYILNSYLASSEDEDENEDDN